MKQDILIPKKEVCRQTSLSPVTIWRKAKDGDFPEAIKISAGRVAWAQSEVSKWISQKMGGMV